MAEYLDKFAGTIGKRQSEQILRLLNKQRNSGQIRSVQEFTQKLQDLVTELTSSVLTPSLKTWIGEKSEEIDSESYNFMLERVEDDLEAGFEEANNIDEVQQSHEAIIRDVALRNLRAGVAELDGKITLFEFLNKDTRGFDSAIFSTFRESKEERTQRQGTQVQTLFTDPRTNVLIPATEDAEVELIGERLVLAKNTSTFHNISAVRQIFDSESPQSEKIVEPPGTSLANMIDDTSGTYWIQSLLFKERQDFVKVKFEFDLGAIREVNVVEVEPASQFGLILEDISYIDSNNTAVNLNILERNLESRASVRFAKVATDRIILTFRNENFKKSKFQFNDDTPSMFSQAVNQQPIKKVPDITSISKELIEVIPSIAIQKVLGLFVPPPEIFDGYQFTSGIDNVRMGIAQHEDRSIYVSSPLEITGVGELGVRSDETRPYFDQLAQQTKITSTTYDITQDSSLTDDSVLAAGENSNTYFLSSIEYWIIKQDLNAAGQLQRTSKFPILPLDVDRVYHERVLLTDRSVVGLELPDQGQLLFFSTRTDSDIKIYRNGVLLIDETGNAGASVGWQDVSIPADKTPGDGTAMKLRIQLLGILAGDIYTASYTPVTSSTNTIPKTLSEFSQVGGINVVDMVGDLSARLCPAQVVVLDRIGENDTVQTSRVFLAIVLRQNAAESTLTPAVEEYTLVGGCKDTTKFEDI